MEAYQQRIVDEKNELDDRIDKLSTFIESDVFVFEVDQEQQNLLLIQLSTMRSYSLILDLRVQKFSK